MKVLIADFDLFSLIGGGQTFYRSIIERNPEITFYYLTKDEPAETVRPANARPIPYQSKYQLAGFSGFYDVDPPKWAYRAFVMASNIAASVAGQQFDVVDTPDYEQIALFIRPALAHHQVKVGQIALSLHGRISKTIQLNWGSSGVPDHALELQERLQYSTVDVRYGLSKTYLNEWRQQVDLEAQYLNPLAFVTMPEPRMSEPGTTPPDINFVGRTEKRKGPDIFVEVAWWLPRSSYGTARIIGSESYDANQIGSGFYLYQMSQPRVKDVQSVPALTRPELNRLFGTRSITFTPSRYDTFNLTALESLFSGCPTVIGDGAGVCQFLQEVFPKVPFVMLDTKNIYGCINPIESILQNYDAYREHLVDALLNANPEVSGLTLEEIYHSTSHHKVAARNELDSWYEKLIHFYQLSATSLKAIVVKTVSAQVPAVVKRQVRANLPRLKATLKPVNLRLAVKRRLISSQFKNKAHIFEQLLKAKSLMPQYKALFNAPENTEKDLSQKIQRCWDVGNNFRIDRVRIWREIARLEYIRGNELVAATYQLRAMRLLGQDIFQDLPTVMPVLQAKGFHREALAAEAMYGQHADQVDRCAALLDQALQQNQTALPSWEYELVDDRRDRSQYRVSVIVSLYNAAAKIPHFLTALKRQTVAQAGDLELILVDSGSPGNEYAVFQQCVEDLNIPVVYARSAQRETIQSAWNRGISLARSPYLAFLGVDETILPNCLEILANELDADPTLDWVQGNSLVTNVDPYGTWASDIMVYDRTGYRQDMVYLETCYLSWVGALYRRSIHDRFGYYDASFTAAGDTEFKNRVLPFIKTKSLEQTLGLFWNYPEERTTQHPRAEIEDLRAWYLHRTVAGVNYAFAKRDPLEAKTLFYDCLKYRKSYCRHWSSDLEYACNIGTFLNKTVPDVVTSRQIKEVEELLQGYRSLDWVADLSRNPPLSVLLKTAQRSLNLEQQHQGFNGPASQPAYEIFNDNRHEQHSYLWLTDL